MDDFESPKTASLSPADFVPRPHRNQPGSLRPHFYGHRFNEIDDTNFPALGNGTVSVREALHEWIASQFVQRPHRGR
jgi:hypothetical protein